MTNAAIDPGLLDAIDRYFLTMYDFDLARFDALFAPSAKLHGFRDGSLRILPAPDYRAAIAKTASPRAKAAPRRQEILLVDIASPMQAMAKVRVRIDAILYLDYLLFHRIDDAWRITAKSFHVEQTYDPQRA